MRDDLRIPDLGFPTVAYGRAETPWDLLPLLYVGGAGANVASVAQLIADGQLGPPQVERLELVQQIHACLLGRLVSGGSKHSAYGAIVAFRTLFSWAEQTNRPLAVVSIAGTFLDWTDALLHRVRVLRNLKLESAYSSAAAASRILDEVLGRPTSLLELSRLQRPPKRKIARGVHADKQNLEWTFEFGHLLQDICDGLTLNSLWGPLPVRIALRWGGVLEEWSTLLPADRRKTVQPGYPSRASYQKASDAARSAFEADRTLRTRYPLANLRIEAELLMFIAQTGMNFAQAHQIKVRDFFYASDVDGYKVKERKHRRGGEVLFEIFKEYRAHFERYLEWRREAFPPEEDLVFPLVRRGGRALDNAPRLDRVRTTCAKVGVQFVPPATLRNTRVNWLLRRSGDLDLTAEMAQHTKETLVAFYERPSLQRAMGEVMRFWSQADPILARTIAAAPGECDGDPIPLPSIPKDAPQPDCIQASGCLWCAHHRDVDSLDYVWSMSCFRHLKLIEVSKYRRPQGNNGNHPADYAVARLSDKLRWFQQSNEARRLWVDESLARVEEGNFHPEWTRLIHDVEGIAS